MMRGKETDEKRGDEAKEVKVMRGSDMSGD